MNKNFKWNKERNLWYACVYGCVCVCGVYEQRTKYVYIRTYVFIYVRTYKYIVWMCTDVKDKCTM